MHREGAAEPVRRDIRRQDRVIGGVKDAVRDPDKHHHQEEMRVGRRQPKTDKGQPGDNQRRHQHAPRPEPVDQRADRQLRRDRHDIGDGQRKAQLDKADAELRL